MATNFTQNSQQSSASILKKIAYQTGLDNPTKTQKVGTIVDALRGEISEYSGFISEKINDMRYTTATERALDVIGNAEEVYRNTVQYVDITAEQMVAKVKLANGATFNTVRGTNSVINAGTRFKIDSDVEVQFLDSVQLLPREKEIYFSLRLFINPSKGGVSIAKGRQMVLPITYNEYSNSTEAIVIQFDEPIRFDVSNTDDDFYRARIGAKKTDPMRTTGQQLELAVREVLGVTGCYIKRHMRGPGTIDIGFVTKQMMEGLATARDADYVKQAIENNVRKHYSYAAQVKVIYPTECKVIFEYRNFSSIPDDTIADSILKAFKAHYAYDNNNGISIRSIEEDVKAQLKTSDFEIVQAQLYDPVIDYIISISSEEIVAPINVYMTTSSDLIRKVD